MEYLDISLKMTDEDLALRDAAHKFAEKVMRPISIELDRMTPDEVIAEGSPFWEFMKKAYELGYHKLLIPEPYGLGLSPFQTHIVFEELGWGSFGLSVQLGVACFPAFAACITGDDKLIEEITIPFCNCTDGSLRGCWAITEPDHGTDYVSINQDLFTDPRCKGNIQARLKGTEYVISGQKSAWVSGGTIATHALLFCQIDPSKGMAGSGVCIVPLDLPGVSKGKALSKMGQRDLNQGEIYFDEVRIPQEYMFVQPDFYPEFLEMLLAYANGCMSTWSTGIARAAFEESLTYAKERIQGGLPLIQHRSVRARIFGMFAKVETIRAFSRAVLNFNLSMSPPFAEYAVACKPTCTQLAFEVTHEAVQILGGNGLTSEYITEKLFRDARATLIEDGVNEGLLAEGGGMLHKHYPRNNADIM
jgi:acyl-CoA dehydrogenase